MVENKINRRQFLKTNAAVTFGLALGAGRAGLAESRKTDKPIRIGIIGVGGRGQSLMRVALKMENVLIPAVCDINKKCVEQSQHWIAEAGQPKPEGYSKDEYSYKKLLERDDLDAVIIATYWQWHTPMAVDAMKAGKYVGVEVPAAYTLEECWQLVNTYEQTKVPCMMLENWSFRSDNLAVLNMIRKGLLGKIVHCHCAHSHDCIDHWFFDHQTGKDRWPAKYLVNHNRDQYPTHQLGPVVSWMDIGCGDYFDYITSTATDCFGINEHFIRKFGPDHPNAKRKYAQGDIVTTVVKTKKGKTIVINYDMQLPRPYDNRWLIQGTCGIYNEQRNAVYIVDQSPEYHQWEPFPPYHEKYKHSWWKNLSKDAQGHGGTDELELTVFFDAVRNKTQTPLDVYDSVIMSVTGPLSEESIAKGSVPVKVPDFTHGGWKTSKPAFALEI
ncbi:MAG: Gfo/Idh/MocA family oxidoreductase [Planctomycetota bacterium]|jgi:predicted dehydrogenase